jgi:flagellar biosynthesis GTPase FlhF
VCHLLPKLIPIITNQVWDTKAQVTKAAASALLAVCETNENPDISPAIPAVVNAIYKPSTTNAAVQELMGTTFVASVDASTLSILCPVLARALKEKLAINKRAACIVISNMSRLVDSPQAVAPFGPLLVPELKKVATNVQFEEIRDAALSALGNLTKALGDSYNSQEDAEQKAEEMAQEAARIEAEKQRIEDERNAEREKEEAMRQKELEERKKFKEAMDAQRELDNLAAQEAEEKRKEEAKKKDKEMRSTKAGGKCQSCGLKKCKKTCMFYSE